MIFPKPTMSITELVQGGFYSRWQLECDVNAEGQNFAWRTSRRGKWQIDVESYQKWLSRKRRR